VKNTIRFLIIFAFGVVVAAGSQNQKPPVTLTPQASKYYIQIDKAQEDLRRQYQELERNRAMLLAGADVPADWQCTAGQDGIVVCAKPAPTPKPSPTP